MKVRSILLPVGVALLVMIVNVALSFLWVAVYSYAINPGQPDQFYTDYAQRVAPVCSIVMGAPLMFLAGRWLARRNAPSGAVRSALIVWGVYAAIDLAALASVPFSTRMSAFTAVSLATKLVAVLWGARTRQAPLSAAV